MSEIINARGIRVVGQKEAEKACFLLLTLLDSDRRVLDRNQRVLLLKP